MVKRLSAMWETQVRSLCGEDSLEKEMATHSRILAWRILWTEEPGGLQSMGSQRVRHDTHRTCAYLEGRLTGAAPRRAQAPHATSEGLEGGFTSLLRAGGFGSVLRECTVAMNTPSTT